MLSNARCCKHCQHPLVGEERFVCADCQKQRARAYYYAHYKPKPPRVCECGVTIRRGWRGHENGVMHKHGLRIKALLDQNCMGMAEIAERVGVTRERVRQIAKKFFGRTGRERKTVCALSKRSQRKAESVTALVEKAASLGLTAIPVGIRLVKINGFTCKLRKMCIHKQVQKRKWPDGSTWTHAYYPASIHGGKLTADFAIYREPTTDTWMIFPAERLPKKQATFSIKELKLPGAKNCRHDYRDYIEAWHLLKVVDKA